LGQDYLYGGAGNDTADYTTFNGNATYDLGLGTANLGVFTETMSGFENIKTGAGNDTILGVAGDPDRYGQRSGNNISTGSGNDEIAGSAGNDTIDGGGGNDFILGGAGNDYIQGGLGQDYLDGGSGGYDTVDYRTFSGKGIYDLRSGSADLTGAFTETMLNFENLYAGAGDDIIFGVDGNYSSPAAFIENLLDGGAGNDYIQGGSGKDEIIGGAGNDTILAGDGNDYVQGGLGQDYLNGGAGTDDTVDYTTFNGGGTYDLGLGTANLGVFTETMLNFENIMTGSGNDTIIGSDTANGIRSGEGNDTLSGGSERDYLDGGSGNDTLYGGDSDDDLVGEGGNDIIDGGSGNDTLFGNAGDDYLNGGTSDDRFFFGGDILDGASNTIANLLGVDTIADFTKTQDKITLSKGTFLNITNAAGELSFATAISDTAAAFSDAKIVFSTSSNKLFYNQNAAGNDFGPNGGAFAVVNIVGGGSLALGDFTLD
jgi:Ca2+-binding RTX toxin-like protein